MADPDAITTLSQLLSPDSLKLLEVNGNNWVQQIGLEVIRGVVLDVLVGRNLRDSTEALTRHRIASLNLAMVNLFLQGITLSDDFVRNLPYLSTQILARKRLSRAEKWLAQWMLGLTDKAFQNVLRDNTDSLADYRDRYIETCSAVIEHYQQVYGKLSGAFRLSTGVQAEINWLTMTYLLNAVGAQTLAIRGSEKSVYGKLFEKLILGSALRILGFRHVQPDQIDQSAQVFWLSSRSAKRESDATLLYKPGQGVRFDIGFIGRGNPEISLDKVTRFEREITLGRSRYYMATIIIVDRVGRNSRIERLAQDVQGTIIQMSAGFWPQQVARVLHEQFGFEHPLINMEHGYIESFLRERLANVPLQDFIQRTIKSSGEAI